MTDKVLFLDFDGPLCNARIHLAYGDKGTWHRADPVVIAALNRCIKAGTKIVLTTSWVGIYSRMDDGKHEPDKGIRYCKSWLRRQGLNTKGAFHKDIETPKKLTSTRTHEINMWLEVHPEVTQFIVLDDIDMTNAFPENMVLVDPYSGFTDKTQIRRMLEQLGVKL